MNKSETRNPKLETNPNSEIQKPRKGVIEVLLLSNQTAQLVQQICAQSPNNDKQEFGF
jgi:hypothetical protein